MDKNDVSLVCTQIIFSLKKKFCKNFSISENTIIGFEDTNVSLDINFLPRYFKLFLSSYNYLRYLCYMHIFLELRDMLSNFT